MGFLAAVGAAAGPIMQLVGAKYNADLQGHLQDRAADQNYTLARDTALINEGISQRAFQAQKAWDLEMWEKDKAYQNDLWNRQNEYNSPAAQMARMKSAGLNPMLMYNMGTPGNATVINAADPNVAKLNVPEMSTPRREPVYTKVGQGLGSDIVEGILKYMQIKNIGLDNEIKDAQKSLIDQQTRVQKVNADTQIRELNLLDRSGSSIHDSPLMRELMRRGVITGEKVKKFFGDKVDFMKSLMQDGVEERVWNRVYK